MASGDTLLLAAIEDNIAWCSAVCTAHHSDERNSASAWVNLAPSPPFYPNLITRRPNSQAEIVSWIEDIQRRGMPGAWAVKDSFHDLDFSGLGLSPVIEGQWFGGEPLVKPASPDRDWETVRTLDELSFWEEAWGEDTDHPVFKEVLLADTRIRFWMLRDEGEILAGCISSSSGTVTGLSNWFSKTAESVFDLGLLRSVVEAFPGKSIVFWASGSDAAFSAFGFRRLGKLRVWIAERSVYLERGKI